MRQTVADELLEVKEKYSDRRRTQIVALKEGVSPRAVLTTIDFTPDKPVWVVVDGNGLISRTLEDKSPRLWGRKAPRMVLKGNTRDTLYLVAKNGNAAAIALHALPEAEMADQGIPVSKVCPLSEGDTLAAIFSLSPKGERAEGWYMLLATRGGMVKKSALEELPGPTAQMIQATRVKEGDAVGWVGLTNGSDDILMVTASGMGIRFSEDDIRPMGLAATGVNGIKLKEGDEVVGVQVVDKQKEAFLLTSDGNAKRVRMSQFPVQGRYGRGVAAWKLPEGVYLMGLANDKPNYEVTIHFARSAAKRVRLDDAPIRTRPSKGKAVVEVKANDRIVALTVPWVAPTVVSKASKRRDQKKAAPKPKPEQIAMALKAKKTATKKASTKKSSSKRKT
jgi:DNA gyrase/topoisomerase IV subunit A